MIFVRAALLVTMGVWLTGFPAHHAAAQFEGPSGGFITPFPENDIYQVLLVGDTLAEGLLGGVLEALAADNRVQVQRRPRTISGLSRFDAADEEIRGLEESITKTPVHIAVVMMGAADRNPIRVANTARRLIVGTDEWRAEYGRRVDRVIRALKRRNVAVYWVGLPIVRRTEWNEDVEKINEVLRERANLNAIRYIDAYTASADEAGIFNAYGADVTGKMKQLREADGVHFTQAGNRKLAFFVERELKRDITQARNDRNIPLAGSEAEQRRMIPARQDARGETAPQPGAASPPATKAARSAMRGQPGAAQPTVADQRAETARITFKSQGAGGREESVSVEIVRPSISASVIAAVTRRESADRPSQVGETITDTLPGGLVVLRSISLPAGAAGAKQKLSPTQMPYFRVLVKGERLTPRPGRADDFRWPRADDIPPDEPQAAPDQAPRRGRTPAGRGQPQRG